MISVVLPTLNAERTLTRTLAALVPGTVEGVVREVIIVDGGSDDATAEIADLSGADFLISSQGRGAQLAKGGASARSEWLLFLHADTVLSPGWDQEVATFINRVESGDLPLCAAAFRFALNDFGVMPRLLEMIVSLRCAILRLPYGDQGLLIHRQHYRRIGGFRPLPLMEDVDLVRRIGWRNLTFFRTVAVTSAARYKEEGYLRRVLRNLTCLSLYFLRVPPKTLVRIYG
ncbi:MAG: TIGR04283 family arsenosugar biosynthesis glycosyltransferase [Pseudomonadota bacterium]|nr:TIGR04283 family arsenosugar biosynthesis glycosyltransferase [Pseudomonadota bacterium]